MTDLDFLHDLIGSSVVNVYDNKSWFRLVLNSPSGEEVQFSIHVGFVEITASDQFREFKIEEKDK